MLKEIRFWGWFMILSPLFCCSQPAVKSYQSRGLVSEVAGSGAELSVAIHHEQIPQFQARDGSVSDMGSMTMIFGVSSKVDSSVLAAGSKVKFDFDVRWNQRPSLWITRAEPLADATALALTNEHDEHQH
jgi:Cu/Ag efflux protein CusF